MESCRRILKILLSQAVVLSYKFLLWILPAIHNG